MKEGALEGDPNVIAISHRLEKRHFTFEEAEALLPIIKKVTGKIASQVELLLKQLDSTDIQNSEFIAETEAKANSMIEEWHEKMAKLGVKAKGLWYVDFDNGSGYYCWKFPETGIFFEHTYQDGFTGRTLIDKSRPWPKETERCSNAHEEPRFVSVKNRSCTDKLTPWRL